MVAGAVDALAAELEVRAGVGLLRALVLRYDRVRHMIADPSYRKLYRAIETALASRPVLSGADVAVLVAP